MVYHFIQFGGHLSDNGRQNQREKKYDFKFMQISVDRALMVFISDMHDQIFSWPVSTRVSSVKIRIDIMTISQSL